MTISDTSPECRNLILTSLAFIIFYAGDGRLLDDKVKLIFINVTFDSPHVLTYFFWIMIFWFCLRYWQKSGFKFWSHIATEITSSKISPSLSEFAKQKAIKQLSGTDIEDYQSNSVDVQHWSFENFFILILCDFKTTNGAVVHQETVTINGIKGILLTSRKILIHSAKDNAFAEELMPYILFCLAVTAPIWSVAT